MDTGNVIGLIGLAGAGVLIYGYRLLASGGEAEERIGQPSSSETFVPGEPMPPGLKLEEQEITLEKLKILWRDGEVKKLEFEQLSRIWRKAEVKAETKVREPVFLHEGITKFYLDRVRGRPYFVGDALNTTLDLLELLDKEGNCSSVVRLNEKEPERSYDGDTYNQLAQVPLFQHSINVACAAMDKVGKGSIVPKAALAALAHDLGKIPFYYNSYYKNSAHPAVGFSVAETVPSLKSIKWFDEIAAAIRNHHGQSTEYLDALLREADQAARRFEMTSTAAAAHAAQKVAQEAPPLHKMVAAAPLAQQQAPAQAPDPVAPAKPTEAVQSKTVSPTLQAPTPPTETGSAAPPKQAEVEAPEIKARLPKAAAPVESERQERKRVPRQLKDISAWFDADRFIMELTKIINTTQTGDKFWSALALGGYLYVKPVGMYGLVVRHSKNNPDVVTAGASEQDRDDYLYSVVMELKKKKDLVATEFLSGDRFGAVFFHNPGTDNSGTKQFLIPFRSDYFGEEIARAENRRNTLMKKTVALVPAFTKGGN